MPVSDVPKNTHKGRSSSLSSLWKPIRRDSLAREIESKGHSHQWSDIQHISSPIPPGMMDDTFAFPVQEETSGGSNLNAMAAMAREIQANGSPNASTAARTAPSLVSPSPSEKKRNQLSLRRIFQHRKSSSKSSSMHERQRSDDHALEPTISSPWGLTVASFRPAPVPKTTMTMSESIPDLRQLTIENAILISRESDSNGLLAQSRAREMPAPVMPLTNGFNKGTRLERSKSLGQYVVTGEPLRDEDQPRARRYEASSMCEKFVLPRPRLVALTITPPSSPPQRATSESQTQRTYSSRPEGHVVGRTSQLWEPSNEDGRGASPSLSGHRVLREGVQRDREREDWAAKARTAPSQRLRMRVSSAGRDAHQDKKYQLARFAPQPVGFEPVYDLELPSSHVVGRRVIKQRSGSLGNLIAADRSGDHATAASMQRRDSEPAFARRTATSTFLRHLAQSMRNRKVYPEDSSGVPHPPIDATRSVSTDNTLVRKASAPSLNTPPAADYRDKPLPAEPMEPSSRRSSAIRHSVSSPNLRTPPMADSLSPPRVGESNNEASTPTSLATRDSAIDLLSNFVVADRLAHPVERAAIPSSPVKSPPAPIRILREGDEPVSQPFTPTRQAAWDQWHTMQPRSPSSPIPERLPLDTVLALASRQLTSPRQKRPSMEEAVNRARMANQLFGDADSQHSASNTPVQVLSVGPNGRFADGLSATTVGSPQRGSQNGAQSFSPRSPRTVQPLMATPGSTDASPMPGASFEDIERVSVIASQLSHNRSYPLEPMFTCPFSQDLFFARPRRLWGTPVALPSRENGHHQRLNSADSSTADRRQSKGSAGSSSTRMALTSDDYSQDNHGQVEVTTPNLSQDGYGRTRFSAISEEGRTSESGNTDLLDLDDSAKGGEWPQRGNLSRDASGDTGKRTSRYLP